MGGITVTFRHSPMNVRPSENVEYAQEVMMVITRKRLGEKVGHIVSGGDLLEQDRPGFDELTEVVVSNVDMLHLSVILRILCKGDCSPTVPLDDSWHLMFNLNLIQPRLHPDHLLDASGYRNVFRLDSGKCNCGLSLTTRVRHG